MKNKNFSEYRHKDYHIPRTLREAYGWEPPLYVEEKEVFTPTVIASVVVCCMAAVYAVVLWVI